MIKNVDEYFKQNTDKLSFVELKENSEVKLNGYKLKGHMPLPIVIDELIHEIKEKRAQEELKMLSIIEGIIYTIGIDRKFRYYEEYKKILYSYDENIENYIVYKGTELVKEGNLKDSIIYFRALININKDNINGLYNYALGLEELAKKFYKNKNINNGNIFIRESTKYFEKVLDIDPNFSMAYYKLGFHYMYGKQYKKSQIIWEKFLELSEEENMINEIEENLHELKDDVEYEEGYNYILRGNPKKGLEKLEPLKEKYSDWWNLIFMIGLAYRQMGVYVKAKEEFENVLAINPNQVDALNELGLCLAYLGKYQEAVEKFTEAINLRPKDYEILCNRGMTYLQANMIEEAKEDIYKAYDINPNDEITIACKREIQKLNKN